MTLPFLRKADPTHFEYAENWGAIALYTRWLLPRCTVNPFLPAQCVHHLKYKRSLLRRILSWLFFRHSLGKSVAGYEIPGWDCIPVSDHNHHNHYGLSGKPHSVHYSKVWRQHQGRPINNYQVAWKAWELRLRFWVLVLLWHQWKVLMLIGIAIASFTISLLVAASQ